MRIDGEKSLHFFISEGDPGYDILVAGAGRTVAKAQRAGRLSVSFIATLAPNEKTQVAEQLRALIASHPALRERDSIAFPYRTEVYWCTRL